VLAYAKKEKVKELMQLASIRLKMGEKKIRRLFFFKFCLNQKIFLLNFLLLLLLYF